MAYLAERPDLEMLWFQESHPPAEMLREWGAEGLLGIFSKHHPLDAFLALEVPIVNVSSTPFPSPVSNVGVDQREVGRLAAEHLRDKGLPAYAYLGLHDYQFSIERGRAYSEALAGETVHTCILPPKM